MASITNPSTGEKQQIIKSWLKSGSINLFGRPYAGKDTQCERLAAWLDAPIIGGGDIIRGTKNLAPQIRQAEESGALVPQDSYIALIAPYFRKDEFKGKPLALSSLGRWHGEEDPIMQAAAQSGHSIKCVVHIAINPKLARQRFEAAHTDTTRIARSDHDAYVLETRLKEFAEKTMPALDFYKRRGLLEVIDGTRSIQEVEMLIIDALYRRATSRKVLNFARSLAAIR